MKENEVFDYFFCTIDVEAVNISVGHLSLIFNIVFNVFSV